MGSDAWRDASRISSAFSRAGVVGHSIASKPASRASWKRSVTVIEPGSMLNSTALRMGRRRLVWAGKGDAKGSAAMPPRIVRRVMLVLTRRFYRSRHFLLAIEILSPDDRLRATLAKCEEYHAWGTPYC